MTYQDALDFVASLAPRGWRLGLDRMQAFCEAAGLDECLGAGFTRFIHVAGTNGKGSTTAYLQSLMVEAGYRTGAFFSPYVVDPRERVQFGRDYISEEDFTRLTDELKEISDSFRHSEFDGVTEFEFKTALGFLYWKRMQCDWVALEVGLGGRLDATNVVTPKASIVVSIGMDHMHILGDTHAKIAYEKAGIIKPGVPVIVGEMSDEARTVIHEVAHTVGAPIWQFGRDITFDPAGALCLPTRTIEGLQTGIVGTKQRHNMALAVAALEASGATLDEDAIRRGTALARIPGRFEQHTIGGRHIVFDGAHNEDASRVLRESLDSVYPGRKVVLVTNMLVGHEVEPFYEPLIERVKEVHLVPIGFHRARNPLEIASEIERIGMKTRVHTTVHDGVLAALESASSEEVVVVTGSFYLVGEAIQSVRRSFADH